MTQMYALTIHAVGEVRDAEGNLIETVPIEETITISEEDRLAILGESA